MSKEIEGLLNKIKGLEDRITSLEKKLLDKSPAIEYPPNLDNPDFREALTQEAKRARVSNINRSATHLHRQGLPRCIP